MSKKGSKYTEDIRNIMESNEQVVMARTKKLMFIVD